MNVIFIILIIGYVSLLSLTGAQFPFQTGPVLYDPYASFFGSTELNPFANNAPEVQMGAVPTHHHHHHHPKRPNDKLPHRHRWDDSITDILERERNSKIYESEPSKWKKYSPNVNTFSKTPIKRDYKKMLAPVPKSNGHNNALIRPRPETEVDSIQKHISYKTNHFNSKPVINYRNSNSFRDSVPQKPNEGSEKRTDNDSNDSNDSDDEPTNLDIELNGDEDNEEYNHRDDERDRGKAQYSLPPNNFKPHNYHIKERAYTFDKNRHHRPALYEIEAPKNLERNRPNNMKVPTFVQKITVPHNTLMEIADLSGPPRMTTSRRPHPFEGFHQRTRPKTEAEIIVNSLGNGMTRQVGASMSVELEEKKFEPRGKVFDEPINDSERRSFGKAYQYKPFRPNERNSFNSKHFDTFSNNENNNNNKNDFRAIVQMKNKEEAIPYVAGLKSDEDYDDSSESSDTQEVNESPKKSDDFEYDDGFQPGKGPQIKSFDEQPSQQSSQRPPLQESETEKTADNIETSEEWSSNGIPGQPGKDYPMLSGLPLTTEFSCTGRPYGFYADVSQKCQVYHQCSAQGSQKFLCPNGTLFSQESLVCEWWYNVLCENSEQLYHKNAQLYRNDGHKQHQQNDDRSNDEKRHNSNEYNVSWNSNNNNDYHNRNDNQNNYNHNHNQSPHNHYSNNHFRANSNRNKFHSRAPHPEYGEEIDVDLSNDESRNKFIKFVSNPEFVSKMSAFNNKTKNSVFRP